MKRWTMELINVASTHSRGAEFKGSMDGKEPHSFLRNLKEAHPLQKKTVQMDRVNEVCSIYTI